MSTPAVAILTHDFGWHGEQLQRAFAERGVTAAGVPIHRCRLTTEGRGTGLYLPGLGDRLPQAALVRGIPGGSLEEIVLCLDVLHALRHCGVPVYNPAAAIERSVDKAMTSWLLARAGVPTPPARAVTDPAQAQAVRRKEEAAGHQVVLKPLFGSMGQGIRLLEPGAPLPAPAEVNGVYYLQRFVPPVPSRGWCDWRILVIGGRAAGAMQRFGRSWVNNRAQGGDCRPAVASEALEGMAVAATRTLGLEYAGVDLIQDSAGGFQVLEVNGVPAWKGLQSVLPDDLAGRVADGCRASWARAECHGVAE